MQCARLQGQWILFFYRLLSLQQLSVIRRVCGWFIQPQIQRMTDSCCSDRSLSENRIHWPCSPIFYDKNLTAYFSDSQCTFTRFTDYYQTTNEMANSRDMKTLSVWFQTYHSFKHSLHKLKLYVKSRLWNILLLLLLLLLLQQQS